MQNFSLKELEYNLARSFRKAKDYKLPLLILFEYNKKNKRIQNCIHKFLLPIDPRGFRFLHIRIKNFKQKKDIWPYFWYISPSVEKATILSKSWYSFLKNGKYLTTKEIKEFEKSLSNFALIIKFFLLDKKSNEMESIVDKTNYSFASWQKIDIRNLSEEEILDVIYSKTIQKIEEKINQIKNSNLIYDPLIDLSLSNNTILDTIDLNKSLSEETYKEKLSFLQKKLKKLQKELCKMNKKLILVFEGWDASGKGGTIKRLVNKLDPTKYIIFSISAPSELEKKHHYLWRFWNFLYSLNSTKINIIIFDRSWYGRLLVERIEGFCSTREWEEAFEEIKSFEKILINNDYIILKFWLHIDKDTQLSRFRERENNPYKNWKITEEDWRNREKWDYYKIAFDDIFKKTNTKYAPWFIIESNFKWYGRLKVLEIIANELKNF